MSYDEISNQKYYNLFPDGVQAIDVIEASLTPEEFAGYLKGSVLKYRLRAGEKGPAEESLGKAEWYRDRLYEHHDHMGWGAFHAAAQQRADSWTDEEIKASAFPSTGVFGPMQGDWPDETRRQDAAAEDEAFAAIKPYTGQGGVQIRCSGCAATSCECLP